MSAVGRSLALPTYHCVIAAHGVDLRSRRTEMAEAIRQLVLLPVQETQPGLRLLNHLIIGSWRVAQGVRLVQRGLLRLLLRVDGASLHRDRHQRLQRHLVQRHHGHVLQRLLVQLLLVRLMLRGLPLLLLRGDAEEASLRLHALLVSRHGESSKRAGVSGWAETYFFFNGLILLPFSSFMASHTLLSIPPYPFSSKPISLYGVYQTWSL